ncbi:UNVERIFIED_ORG: hypothetical protein GGD51_003294 [Rhizobium esperanzae]|nr:hypothetical protein RLPCCGM1_p0528 [Rhizobium leguminosarum bv. phaseoli CCGM1]
MKPRTLAITGLSLSAAFVAALVALTKIRDVLLKQSGGA